MPVEAKVILDERLTVNEAAECAGVHQVTIRKWMFKGILPYKKTKTGRVRIEPEDLKTVLSLD